MSAARPGTLNGLLSTHPGIRSRARADAADGDHGHLLHAADKSTASWPSDLSLPQSAHRSLPLRVGRRSRLHSDAERVRLSLCDLGLSQSASVGVASVQYATHGPLSRGGAGGDGTVWPTRDLQYRSRLLVDCNV